MTKFLIGVSALAVLALSICGVLVLLEARALIRDVRTDAAVVDKDVTATLELVRTAAAHTADASQQASLAAAEQRAYWQKTSLETYKTMASLRLTIVRTDHSLNDQVAPALVATLRSTDALTRQASIDLQDTMNQLTPSLTNLARASSAAADTIADPHIRETLVHVDETTGQLTNTTAELTETMKQLAGVATNAKIASDLALARLRDALRPQKLIVTLLEKAFGMAAQGAQIYYATK